MSETGSESVFDIFRRRSEEIAEGFYKNEAPVLVRIVLFFSLVCVATGMWICSNGPPPFSLAGRNLRYTFPGKLMMFTGAMIIITGLIGIIECKGLTRVAIISLIRALCTVMVLETVAGSSAVALSYSLSYGFFNLTLTEDLEVGFWKHPHVTLYLDHLQEKLGCCGVTGPDDWKNSYWHEKKGESAAYPHSCCKGSSLCDLSGVYEKGCGATATSVLQDRLVSLYSCSFVCAVIHLTSYLMLTFLEGKV